MNGEFEASIPDKTNISNPKGRNQEAKICRNRGGNRSDGVISETWKSVSGSGSLDILSSV